MNKENKINKENKLVVIKSLMTGEEVASYLNLEPRMALFAYVQGLNGFHNTWDYKEQIKSAEFIEGKHSIALDDYAVLKTK